MQQRSRYQTARRILIFWTLFIGIGAVGGALMMLLDPSGKTIGMDAMLPYFQVLPFADRLFQNFTFSGIALLLVNGVTNLTAAGLLLARRRAGTVLGGIFGVTLMLWIGIQFYMFPFNFMSTIYFIFGLCQAATGYAAWVFARQEAFAVHPEQYPAVGTDPRRLVVYFSRMGYVRQQAYAEAQRTGAALYEIHAAERTEGSLGFWWCGRYGMHRWAMPIQPLTLDLKPLAVAVLRAHDHMLRPRDDAVLAGQAQAALDAGLRLLADLDDLGIHKLHVLLAGIDDAEPPHHADLRAGQADAVGVMHGLDHILDQDGQLLIESGHRAADLRQDGVANRYNFSQCHCAIAP